MRLYISLPLLLLFVNIVFALSNPSPSVENSSHRLRHQTPSLSVSLAPRAIDETGLNSRVPEPFLNAGSASLTQREDDYAILPRFVQAIAKAVVEVGKAIAEVVMKEIENVKADKEV